MEGSETQVIEQESTRLVVDALQLALGPARPEVMPDYSFTPIIGLNAVQRVHAYESNVANLLRALDKEDKDQGQTMTDVQDALQDIVPGTSHHPTTIRKPSMKNENVTNTGESTPAMKSEPTTLAATSGSTTITPSTPLPTLSLFSANPRSTIHRATTGSFMEFMSTDRGALYAIGERLNVYINVRDVRETSLAGNLWPVEVIVQPMNLNEGNEENLELANKLVERWCRRAREGVWREIAGILVDVAREGRPFEH